MAKQRLPRRAIPAPKGEIEHEAVPVKKHAKAEPEETRESFEEIVKSRFVPLAKAVKDEQVIIGIVLQPDVVDAHGDYMSAAVIRKAAHKFLSSYNKTVKLGVQHRNFKPKFELLESYTAPITFVLGEKTVKEGSWLVVVKVHDAAIWKKIKKGEITGFSIGGSAKVRKLKKADA
jgi:hypothetical protein